MNKLSDGGNKSENARQPLSASQHRWRGGNGRVMSFKKTLFFVRFRPAPPNSTPGFEGFDIIEGDSSFHRAKLAQGDQGIDSGQQKMRPVIFPTLPEGL
jgi:hypothetical protein